MTKKISCRVIDSIPLPDDQPNMHLGWCLNAKIYSHNNSSQNTFKPRPPTGTPQTAPNPAGKNLDCYA